MAAPHDIPLDELRDIVQDAHLNFLIGAGASAGLFGLLGDIEQLLTAIDRADVPAHARELARASVYASFFRSVIVKNQELYGRQAIARGVLERYTLFLRTINRILLRRRSSILNKQANLFTTNIDLAIEIAAEDLQLQLNDGFTGRLQPRFSTSNFGSVVSRRSLQYDVLSEIPTFNLLKIHGSVGWATRSRQADGDETRGEIAFDGRLSTINRVNQELQQIESSLLPVDPSTAAEQLLAMAAAAEPVSIDAFLSAYEELAIVNPTKEKFRQTVLNQNYYDLLRLFTNELEKENSVLFIIGFSCRDEHIRELIVRAARSNPTLQVVIFAYSPGSISELKSVFDGHPLTNGNIKVVGPPDATDGHQEKFDLTTVTEKFFEPLVPRPPRQPDARVDVNVKLQEPLTYDQQS